jgi:hypothetical protein
MDNRSRIFDIFVNDTKIATEDLNKYKASKFYDIPYIIPAEVTKGKTTLKSQICSGSKQFSRPIDRLRMAKGGVTGLVNPK